VKVLKNYAVFTGRAQRTEYWMFTLFNLLVVVVLVAIGGALSHPEDGTGFLIAIIYYVGTIVPGLAVTSAPDPRYWPQWLVDTARSRATR
jgi:uncharacterized membrane protein YhaH (DUF805 family)